MEDDGSKKNLILEKIVNFQQKNFGYAVFFSTTHDLGVEIAMCETELGIEVKVSKKKNAKNLHGAENVCELTAMKISTAIHHNGGS